MNDSLTRFATGFQAPGRGYRYLQQHRHLWRYAILPIALNLLITLLVLGVLIAVGVWFVSSMQPWLYERLVQWGAWVAWSATIALGVLLLLVCLAAAVLSYKLLSGVLCGYFYGILAEKVETELGIDPAQLRSISLGYELRDTAYRMAVLMLVQLFFFAVSVLPVAGGPIALLGNLYFTWLINGMDYLDIPLAMRGWRFEQKREFAMRHREQTLGLGACVFLFGFVPILGAVLMTTAVVGAVLMHRDLEPVEAEALP
jgi:CysZ protein